MNLNHREIERLEGLVEALQKKITFIMMCPSTSNTFQEKWEENEKKIEFYSNPKNF